MSDAVFEIFTEEIPATLQRQIAQNYRSFVIKKLKENNVNIVDLNIFIGITLNRLVLKLNNADISKEKMLEFINTTLQEFSTYFPRNMLYPQSSLKWIRPIRSIFACIDNEVLSGEFFGICANNGIYIDKFTFVKCNSVAEYYKIITDNKMVLDYNTRVEFIKNEIQKYKPDYRNNKLIDEIAGMSERCNVPIMCVLAEKFLVLPFELIELVLRENQRYVVFKTNESGNEEIRFLIFANKNTEIVKKGHQIVATARLDDALFYWKQDEELKKDKMKLKAILSSRIFIDDISWQEYLHRQEELAVKIIKDERILNNVKQLIWDTKLDLATGVVAEFPELQGVIGKYYFGYGFNPYYFDKHNDNEVWLYYYLIDRISYIITMYQQGKQPTGNGDKYKVKVKMDDVINVILKINVDVNAVKECFLSNQDICLLYKKRLQAIIENNYNGIHGIKDFAKICASLVDKGILQIDVDLWLKYYNDDMFVKVYKRLAGYTQNVEYDNQRAIVEKANTIFKDNDMVLLNDYLDKHNIDGNDEIKTIFKFIQVDFFEKRLPLYFLSK
ncbi:MAG: glycine--tRNA ligase subunit beta [Rickettsiales bacterium]|nr:glycine--tRNA ligase subunit beta [Rickettsiales bacterium]